MKTANKRSGEPCLISRKEAVRYYNKMEKVLRDTSQDYEHPYAVYDGSDNPDDPKARRPYVEILTRDYERVALFYLDVRTSTQEKMRQVADVACYELNIEHYMYYGRTGRS